MNEPPPFAAAVEDVIAEAFDNLTNGPTWIVGEDTRAVLKMIGSADRNEAVRFIAQASAAVLGSDQ